MTLPSLLPIQPVALLAFTTALSVFYHVASPYYPTSKQKSWILTAGSSCIMTIASLPFVWDFVAGGWTVHGVRTASSYANVIVVFFQAYLLADLTLGAVYYSEHVNLLSGWIHHAVYLIVTDYAARTSISHVFALCACMELPTFILALGTLYPNLRSNLLFALTFFATRIALHIIFLVSYSRPSTRRELFNGSLAPALILACALSLHALWFFNCLKGNLRRYGSRYEHRVRSLKGRYAAVAARFRKRRASPATNGGVVLGSDAGVATGQMVRGPREFILRVTEAATAAAAALRQA